MAQYHPDELLRRQVGAARRPNLIPPRFAAKTGKFRQMCARPYGKS
jgi:hypothetical protein